jgi:plastocyanin
VKLRIALVALAATALIGLAACGGDDDDDTTEAATTTEATTTAEEPAGGGGGGGAASAIEVNADPGGSLAFEEDSLEASAGEVTIEFYNESSLPHDVRVEDADGNDIGGTDQITGGETEATVDLETGEYTFFCSVPGHREGGMEGPLTVE